MGNFGQHLGRLAIVFALLIAALFFAAPVWAQSLDPAGPASGIVDEQQKIVDELKQKTDEFETRIAASRDDDNMLVEIRLQLEDLARALLKSGLAFRPRLAEINARIEQLGPPPGEGQPAEPEIITSERQALAAEKAKINAVLGAAETLSLRVNGLIDRIAELRRDLFASLLTKRYDIQDALGGEVVDAFYSESAELGRTVRAWSHFVIQFKLRSALIATFFALLAAAILLIGGRRLFGRLIDPDPGLEKPSYLSRLSVAFWSTLLPTAAISVFLVTTYFLYDYFSVLRPDIGTMMTTLFIVIGIIFFVTQAGQRGAVAAAAELASDFRRDPGGATAALAGFVRPWSSPASTCF